MVSTTKEDLQHWEGDILYHGTNSYWVAHCLKNYGGVFCREPEFVNDAQKWVHQWNNLLSVATSIPEALSYAVRSSHDYQKRGSVLIIPVTKLIAERLDKKSFDERDTPLPYLLPGEFQEYIVNKLPKNVSKILRKDDLELYQMLGDSELSKQRVDVDGLARKLVEYCTGHIHAIRQRAMEIDPHVDFGVGDVNGVTVLHYLEENGALCEDFTRNFGGF
ncbi:hypothetical protein HYX11_00730 [Candidatus Woesearchaeota archaeon]|nr:hypothetical protein [Candidatus Woesearchaeota archaeon]